MGRIALTLSPSKFEAVHRFFVFFSICRQHNNTAPSVVNTTIQLHLLSTQQYFESGVVIRVRLCTPPGVSIWGHRVPWEFPTWASPLDSMDHVAGRPLQRTYDDGEQIFIRVLRTEIMTDWQTGGDTEFPYKPQNHPQPQQSTSVLENLYNLQQSKPTNNSINHPNSNSARLQHTQGILFTIVQQWNEL